MKMLMQRIFLAVDPSIPGYCLLSAFKFSECRIRRIKTAVPLKLRRMVIDLVSINEKHQVIDAFVAIQALGDRSFVQPYELLILDHKNPHLQMAGEIVTPSFTLGVDPEDVSEYSRRGSFGRVIRDTKLDRVMGSDARYATAVHVTPVDRIDVNAPLGESDFDKQTEEYLRSLYTPLLMSGTREA